jgi:hypothetical protein
MALQTVPATISAPVAALTASSPIGTILEATIPLVSLYQSGYDTYALFETIFPLAENRLSVESDALEAAIILKMCTACGVTLKQTVMDVLAGLDPALVNGWIQNQSNFDKYSEHLATVATVISNTSLGLNITGLYDDLITQLAAAGPLTTEMESAYTAYDNITPATRN